MGVARDGCAIMSGIQGGEGMGPAPKSVITELEDLVFFVSVIARLTEAIELGGGSLAICIGKDTAGIALGAVALGGECFAIREAVVPIRGCAGLNAG